MPITARVPIRKLSQAAFGEIAFEVMRHTFAIHNQLGRFFEEKIYKQELARRMEGVSLEEPIEVSFGGFSKTLLLDVIVGQGAIFEFKSADRRSGRHRAQLVQYLMLADCSHGKLINVRPEEIEHEFVNCRWKRSDRQDFRVLDHSWNSKISGVERFRKLLTEMLRDLGTGLELSLYEEAIEQCFGGNTAIGTDVDVRIDGHHVGRQSFRLIAPGIAFKLTAFEKDLDRFEEHARRLLKHVDLQAIAWANIGLKEVQFKMLQ
jgi:GxxExxY protein